MYGYNAGQPMAIPIYTVLYCVIYCLHTVFFFSYCSCMCMYVFLYVSIYVQVCLLEVARQQVCMSLVNCRYIQDVVVGVTTILLVTIL